MVTQTSINGSAAGTEHRERPKETTAGPMLAEPQCRKCGNRLLAGERYACCGSDTLTAWTPPAGHEPPPDTNGKTGRTHTPQTCRP